jgi:anti-sigma-K factor RskA
MRCEHEHDDGAYVLGALSPAERAAYERHLATCSFCREAVADIAVLPGLLGRLDPGDFAKLLDPALFEERPPVNRMPDLVRSAQTTRRRERKKLRVRILSTALAAAVVALVVGVGLMFWMGGAPARPGSPVAGPTVAMVAVSAEAPVTAKVNLTPLAGGTQVHLVCSYDKPDADMQSYTIWLKAYGPDGETDTMGSWVASPGKDFSMTGVTHFAGAGLSRLALVGSDGRTLLAYDVP